MSFGACLSVTITPNYTSPRSQRQGTRKASERVRKQVISAADMPVTLNSVDMVASNA